MNVMSMGRKKKNYCGTYLLTYALGMPFVFRDFLHLDCIAHYYAKKSYWNQ